MADSNSSCGPHVELVRSEGVRITRCPCGTLHVTLARNGTTIQFPPEYFAEVAKVFGIAQSVLSGRQPSFTQNSVSSMGQFITLAPMQHNKKLTN